LGKEASWSSNYFEVLGCHTMTTASNATSVEENSKLDLSLEKALPVRSWLKT